jgi:hypothetical protein
LHHHRFGERTTAQWHALCHARVQRGYRALEGDAAEWPGIGCEAAKSHPGVGHVLGLECVNKISKNNMRQVCSVFFVLFKFTTQLTDSNLPHS